MGLNSSLLPEFDHEMATTRRVLERAPADRFNWKPHEKSWALGGLATHIANLPTWAGSTIDNDSFDMTPVGGEPPRAEEAKTPAELLDRFDASVAEARKAIAGASDETLLGPWSLLAGGKEIFTMPRIAVLRSFVMNHLIHHRAQLGVYYRLCDVPVPAMYGPTADERGM